MPEHYLIPESRPDAEVNLLWFHHAGGSALSALPLLRTLPSWCRAIAFELPGRGGRGSEPMAADFETAVADLAPAVESVLDRPTVFFGHSLGALLAYSLVSGLPPKLNAFAARLVVSSARAPRLVAAVAGHPARPFVLRTRESLIAELRLLGGTPDFVFDEPEFLDVAVRTLGHDLHLVDCYREPAPPSGTRLPPSEIWYGRADPAVSPDQALAWRECLSPGTVVRSFSGGHFYPTESHEPAAALTAAVTRARPGRREQEHRLTPLEAGHAGANRP